MRCAPDWRDYGLAGMGSLQYGPLVTRIADAGGMRLDDAIVKYSRALELAAWFGVAIVLIVIWGRMGVLPAASAGDDVWFHESGYSLMTEGILRRPMHDDSIGSSYRDFLPPIPGLVMAASFSAFGLTQNAVGLPSAFAVTVAILGFAIVIRRLANLSYANSFAAAGSFLFLPSFLHMAYQNRYEPYVLMFLSLSALLGSAVGAQRHMRLLMLFFSGLMAGVACAAHYPVAPYVWGLAFLVVYSVHGVAAGVPFAFGTAVVAIAGAIWVWPDYSLFLTQLLSIKSQYDIYWMFRDVNAFVHAKAPAIVVFMLAASAIVLLPAGRGRNFLIYAAAGAFAGIFWWFTLPLYASVSLMIGLAGVAGDASPAMSRHRPRRLRRVAAVGVLALLFAMTVVENVAVAAVATRQWRERDFYAFRQNLRSVLAGHIDGLVLIDPTPHLALREIVPSDRLFQLVVKDQTFVFASRILFDASAARRVSALVVFPDWLNGHIENYPIVRSFIQEFNDRGGKPIAVSAMGFGESVAHRGPYRVNVYLRDH